MLAAGTKNRSLVDQVEQLAPAGGHRADRMRIKDLGQFFTPASVAMFMARMVRSRGPVVSILDPGAGVGTLFSACVEELCGRKKKPREIRITAYEIDEHLLPHLAQAIQLCRAYCDQRDVKFWAELRLADFIESSVESLNGSLFRPRAAVQFDLAILNPPYRKVHSASKARQLLSTTGMETTNLYTAFLGLVIMRLREEGEMVAITPRSFCSGTYFKGFRRFFLSNMRLRRLHVFESREEVFKDQDVLQENLIVHAQKNGKASDVCISSSLRPGDKAMVTRTVDLEKVVDPEDPQYLIRVLSRPADDAVASRVRGLHGSLDDLGVQVSTGRVVDFRARTDLLKEPQLGTAPLIYPLHFRRGRLSWPKTSKKPNAIKVNAKTRSLLVPNETYVLVKRFSAKEEPKRVVAIVHDPERLPGRHVAFENHLNYFHRAQRGLPATLARGLAAFLNSTLVDRYFRQFNGHTQVNATDLRNLRYPTHSQLDRIGRRIHEQALQEEVDRVVERELTSRA